MANARTHYTTTSHASHTQMCMHMSAALSKCLEIEAGHLSQTLVGIVTTPGIHHTVRWFSIATNSMADETM